MKRLILSGFLALLIVASSIGFAYADQIISISETPSGAKLLGQDQNGMTMMLNVGDIGLTPVSTREGTFILLKIDGLSRSNEIGKPDLPIAGKVIAIPQGCELSSQILDYEIEEISLTDLGITDPLMPAQPPVSKSDDPADIPFEFNRESYSQAGYFALPAVQTEILGTMRDLRLGKVAMSPVEYSPTENKLRVYKSLTVRIDYINPDWDATARLRSKHYSPMFEPIYNQIANYTGFDYNFRADSTDRVKYPIKYLIISDRMFETQLQPFIEWKIKKGFTVITAYTDEIGSSNTVIKSYIQSVYNAGTPEDPAPSFVLFVGDAQQIPPFSGTAGSHITDLYFCEYTSDLLPEIYYGRFSAQNTTQLQPQIDKTLEYERYEMPDPSYLEEVTLVSGVDGTYAITHGNGQINYGTNYYFDAAHNIIPHVWLYPASSQGGASSAIIQTISDGVGFYNYTAHCSHSGHADPSFETSHIPGLTNYHKYLLGIGNCCLSNTFGTDYSTPCFGEAFLQVEGKGGIGYIGGTNSTYWNEDYYWGVGYGPVIGAGPTYEQTTLGAYDGVFHDYGDPPVTRHYVTNDAIIFAGNLAVSASGSSRTTYYWEIYHLMGDPSVITYMGMPIENSITHDATILLTAETFTVYADPGSYVGLSIGGVLHGAGYVNSTGMVEFAVDPFGSPGVADIIITAQNRIPYISTIQIIAPEGPFVIHDDYTIDDALGNNDGVANCGETIGLGVQLQNVGPDTAYSVVATLSSSDPYITITDDTETYGTIPGDFGLAYIDGAFTFEVAGNTPDDHKIYFNLAVQGSEIKDTTWTSAFFIPVSSPSLVYVTISVDDAAGGDGNGKLDPGETGNVVVTLQNDGSIDALSLSATLSEDDANVSISDDQGTFGDIYSGGGTGNNSGDYYVVSADAATPMGYLMTMHLDISGAAGFFTSIDFDFVVGDRIVFFYDDFSFDQGWTGLGGSGEWTIGPAVGGTGSDGSGGPDPSEDHSPNADNYLLGNDLTPGTGGDYNSGLSSTYWVYSPLFDLSGFSGVQMRYWHWLGVESSSYDHAYLQVYNGSSWVTLFENSGSTDESSWSEEFYDLSEHADGNMDFQIRFGIGVSDGSVQYCGWNIDDIELKGYGSIPTGSPELVCNPEILTDSLHLGDTSEDTIKVLNTGETLLRVRFSSTDTWLSFNTDQQNISAGDSLILPVTLNTAGLAPGDYSGSIMYSSNDPLNSSGSIAVNMHIYSPDIALSETEINETVMPDQQTTHPLVISNNGPGRLEFDITRLMFNGKSNSTVTKSAVPVPLGYRPSDAEKTADSETEPFYAPSTKAHGGPDLWGYNWIDSDDPDGPAFEWIDISSVGTAVDSMGDDDTTNLIPIGFSFPFYENYYDGLYIGSNGIVTFGSPSRSRTNKGIPDALAPNNMISVWWDDLDPRHGGQVYYYSDVANERFIISFIGIPNYYSTTGTGSLTFQAILQADGKILLQYGTMDPGSDYDGLAGSTIGIENLAGDDGLEVVYNAEYVHSDLAILFTAASWLSVEPGAGSVEPFSSDTIDVGFDATEMTAGTFNGQLTINCNDPDSPTCEIPIIMTVQASLPEPPTLVSPDDGTTEVSQPITLDWMDEPSAVSYQAQVDTVSAFDTPVVDSTLTASQCVIEGLEEGVVHYWRVKVMNAVGWGEWSETRSFTTEITWICGDTNGDGVTNMLDITYLIAFLYKDGPDPVEIRAADVNGDTVINIMDITALIGILYGEGGEYNCI